MEVDSNPFPNLLEVNVINVNLSSLQMLQGQKDVAWDTIVANALFDEIVNKGILNMPIYSDLKL